MILKKSGRVSQPCRLFYNPNDSINNGKEIYVSNKLVIYFRIVVILTVQRYFFFSIQPCFNIYFRGQNRKFPIQI